VQQLIEMAHARGLKVIVVGQHIKFGTSVPTIVMSARSLSEARQNAGKLEEQKLRAFNTALKSSLDPKVPFVDFLDLECENTCEIIYGTDKLLYMDNTHLTLDGVAAVLPKFEARYVNTLPIKLERTDVAR